MIRYVAGRRAPAARPNRPKVLGMPGGRALCRTGDAASGDTTPSDHRGDQIHPGGGRDRGSVTIEVALLAPAVLALLGLCIAAGRYETTASEVDAATSAAARAASLARSAAQARRDATTVATTALAGQTPACHDLAVTIDTTGFTTPAVQVIATGTPARITVTLTCRLDLSGLAPGLPGTKTLTSTSTSTLDTFRATT